MKKKWEKFKWEKNEKGNIFILDYANKFVEKQISRSLSKWCALNLCTIVRIKLTLFLNGGKKCFNAPFFLSSFMCERKRIKKSSKSASQLPQFTFFSFLNYLSTTVYIFFGFFKKKKFKISGLCLRRGIKSAYYMPSSWFLPTISFAAFFEFQIFSWKQQKIIFSTFKWFNGFHWKYFCECKQKSFNYFPYLNFFFFIKNWTFLIFEFFMEFPISNWKMWNLISIVFFLNFMSENFHLTLRIPHLEENGKFSI